LTQPEITRTQLPGSGPGKFRALPRNLRLACPSGLKKFRQMPIMAE
jgi:hypothetical protein